MHIHPRTKDIKVTKTTKNSIEILVTATYTPSNPTMVKQYMNLRKRVVCKPLPLLAMKSRSTSNYRDLINQLSNLDLKVGEGMILHTEYYKHTGTLTTLIKLTFPTKELSERFIKHDIPFEAYWFSVNALTRTTKDGVLEYKYKSMSISAEVAAIPRDVVPTDARVLYKSTATPLSELPQEVNLYRTLDAASKEEYVATDI